MAAHNLACSLRLMGDYSGCAPSRSGHAGPSPGGPGPRPSVHPPTAASLAQDLRAAGVFRDSVELLRDTWEKYRAVLGDDMIDTLRAATSLAVSLRKAGEQSEAMNLAQDTYERYRRRYGSDSPDARSVRYQSGLRLRGGR